MAKYSPASVQSIGLFASIQSASLIYLKEAHGVDVVASVASEAMVNPLRKRHQIACLDVNPHPPIQQTA